LGTRGVNRLDVQAAKGLLSGARNEAVRRGATQRHLEKGGDGDHPRRTNLPEAAERRTADPSEITGEKKV